MREVKFRGLSINGDWYYGLLSKSEGRKTQPEAGYYISNKVGQPWAYQVRPETIGQYTGLKDRNGVEIYEGDIVECSGLREDVVEMRVTWHDELASFCVVKSGWMYPHFFKEACYAEKCVVIGNIHQQLRKRK